MCIKPESLVATGQRQEVDGFHQGGLAGEIDRRGALVMRGGQRRDRRPQGCLLRRSEDPGCETGLGEAVGEGGEMGRRPLFRRAVFRAWAKRDDRALQGEA